MYTIKDFIEREIAVKFNNEEEQKRFLNECKKAGLKWIDGEEATEWVPSDYWRPIEYNMIGDGLSYGNGHDWKIVDFNEFNFVNNQEIHITTDGKTTHAILKKDGKVVDRAKAICSEEDEFNFEIGARLALERLFSGNNIKGFVHLGDGQHVSNVTCVNVNKNDIEQFIKSLTNRYGIELKHEREYEHDCKHEYKVGDIVQIVGCTKINHFLKLGSFGTITEILDDQRLDVDCIRDGNSNLNQHVYIGDVVPVNEIKRFAEKGDYIKIVNPSCTFGDYKEGDILNVKAVDENGIVKDCGVEGGVFIDSKEYLVLEPSIHKSNDNDCKQCDCKKQSREFKVGDRVRIRDWDDMEKEFGLDGDGDIDCYRCFSTYMRHLCGRTVTIENINGEKVRLKDWSNDKGDIDFMFSTDMIEHVEEEKPKFKVGDKVIGNDLADEAYNVTVKGWIGEIVKIDDDGRIDVRGHGCFSDINIFYDLNPKCFDLYEEKSEEKSDDKKSYVHIEFNEEDFNITTNKIDFNDLTNAANGILKVIEKETGIPKPLILSTLMSAGNDDE